MIPLIIRRRTYKILIKKCKGEKQVHLCYSIRNIFPFLGPRFYPEMWELIGMKGSTSFTPLESNEQRIGYLEQALKMTSGSTVTLKTISK